MQTYNAVFVKNAIKIKYNNEKNRGDNNNNNKNKKKTHE